MTTFFLGVHRHYWLSHTEVPLFVSNNTLSGGKAEGRGTLPVRAVDTEGNPGRWALDSGGFTMLQQYGTWDAGPSPKQYVDLVRRYRDEIGGLDWAAPQDWMCEPAVIKGGRMGPIRFAGTGLSVQEHQRRTVKNYLELRALAPDLPILPAVQGWTEDDYARCVDLYSSHGIDLAAEPLVLVGSVCRRQNTDEAGRILRRLHREGVTNLHGLGFKLTGLEDHGHLLATADSQSWSRGARYGDDERMRLAGCNHAKPKHTNCLAYALWWRQNRVLPAITRGIGPRQMELFDDVA